MTSNPFVRRTLATLRRAEFGFFGVRVITCRHTPRRCGHLARAGDLDLAALSLRPCLTSWLMVGMFGLRECFPSWRARHQTTTRPFTWSVALLVRSSYPIGKASTRPAWTAFPKEERRSWGAHYRK